jgi:DNA-binding CsgD family transcriptional regulator/tetratricopeptide (TPR) repeat protein
MATLAPSTLLEREAELEALRTVLEDALAGTGRLVLVAGEAGVGKTSLVRELASSAKGSARMLEGACDPLATPRPLGPLADVAAETGGELAARVASGAPAHELLEALRGELNRRPTVLVLEDLHWADEATLDLVRLLGRRAESIPALVVGTYRDDELEAAHPLRLVVGGLATASGVRRMRLEPLSVSAVRVLSVLRGMDADELHRRTGGNPFFVTEVLAAGDGSVPETVRDAVLARAARLGSTGSRLLEAVAAVPGRAEHWLLEAVCGDELAELDACVAAGMLVVTGDSVAFRHELARVAVEQAVGSARRRALNRAILQALAQPPFGAPDRARLAHHAEQAGDAKAVLEHAAPAGESAAAAGAHREAAEQFARALRFSDGLGTRAIAELLERRSYECFLTGRLDESLAARERALERYRALGDRLREGDQLCWLTRLYWYGGRRDEADGAASAAVELLEQLPPGRELARVYSAKANRRSVALDPDGASHWGNRAIELAERLGDHETVVRTLNAVGTVEGLAGRGTSRLERALELALVHGHEELVSLAYGNLAVVAVRQCEWERAERYLADGIAYTSERDLDGDRAYMLAWRASSALGQGRWDDAAADANLVLNDPGTHLVVRASALLVVGRLRARRGDPDVWAPLDESLTIAEGAAELPKLAPLACARVEAALLGGDVARVAAELEPFDLSLLVDRWIAGELAVWTRRAELPAAEAGAVPEPFALELAGDHAGAAATWNRLGCPYEAALALTWSDDEEHLRQAHDELGALGARPAAALAARRLRARGVRGIAKGPRRATRANAARLTQRELDVLELLAEGLRNAEIGERLFLSRRTVDHHVSAILRKLGARTRGEAAAAAARLGLLEDR